jgi:hypothetical protein
MPSHHGRPALRRASLTAWPACHVADVITLYLSGVYHRCMADDRAAEAAELHKITVKLIPRAWDAANETAALLGLTRTDVINRALQVYAYFERQIADGSEVFIRSKDGEMERESFL